MPDLTIVTRFNSRLARIERSYTRDLETLYNDFRLDALGRIAGYQTGDNLSLWLSTTLESLGKQAAAIGQSIIPQLLNATGDYGINNLAMLERVGIRIDKNQADQQTQTARLQKLNQTLNKPPAWIETVKGRMLTDLSRYLATGEELNQLFDNRNTDRVSAWRAGKSSLDLVSLLDFYSAIAGAMSEYFGWVETEAGVTLGRQAVAAIDERTTDCCLRVHGQIVGMDQPFRLTGSPRFADYVMAPPFHWHCRTAETLYIPEFEEIGVKTGDMRSAARGEIEARRKTGKRQEIHPSHATSKRSN